MIRKRTGAGSGRMGTLADFVLQLGDGSICEVDMVEDETALCSILEGFDDANGEGGVGLWEGKVGGRVVDTVRIHILGDIGVRRSSLVQAEGIGMAGR